MRAVPDDEHDIELSFAAIDRLVGGLPPSARTHREWWANSSLVQALAWRDAGWHVVRPYFDRGVVHFARGARGGSYADRGRVPARSAAVAPAAASATLDVRTQWFWEGNVQAAVVRALVGAGWAITSVADTASGGRGVDVVAARDGRVLLVEVKGFPSTAYARGDRAGQPKPTAPTVQAQHWFAEVLLKAVRLRHAQPDAVVAVALPAHARYAGLLAETSWALDALDIKVLVVDEPGGVAGVARL